MHETLERLVERLASVETGMHAASASAPVRTADPLRAAASVRVREPIYEPMVHYEPTPEPRAAAPDQVPPASIAPATPAPASAPFVHVQRTERPPIDPDLPADTPLEPGIGAARGRSPAERIAASEAALGPALGTLKREGEVTGKANFIAAARRAAQAAASEGGAVEGTRGRGAHGRRNADQPDRPLPRQSPPRAHRRRQRAAGALRHGPACRHVRRLGRSAGTAAQFAEPDAGERAAQDGRAGCSAGSRTGPHRARDAGRDLHRNASPRAAPLAAPTPTASLIAPTRSRPPPPSEPARPAGDVTGSVKPPLNIAAFAAKPDAPSNGALADKLSPAIAGPALRAAAASGNPAAEYEIGVRYSEGRGVPADLELAALWFESAATHGLAPAQYRLGSLYEKGQGVKKDLNRARSLYLQAADKGNAKAIHNLAVLYAEGIDGKPDYRHRLAVVPQGREPRRRRQPVQSRHPLRPRHRRRPEPRRILQVVCARGAAGRRGRRQEA